MIPTNTIYQQGNNMAESTEYKVVQNGKALYIDGQLSTTSESKAWEFYEDAAMNKGQHLVQLFRVEEHWMASNASELTQEEK